MSRRWISEKLPHKEMPTLEKTSAMRRGVRVNSRVALLLEWVDGGGSAYQEKAFTRVVNCCGCLLVAPKALSLEQEMRLTNLATRAPIEAIVVWKGKERTEGWELGVELVNPKTDFWGLEL